MATTLLILLLLAIYHFVYESIIMPMCRLEFRYTLFENRDKLIKLKAEGVISDEVFNIVYYYINSAINRLPYLRLSLYAQARKEFGENPLLRKKIDERMAVVMECGNEDVVRIMDNVSGVIYNAFVGSFGAMLIYILPIFIVVWVIKYIFSIAWGSRKLIQNSVLLPEKEFEKMVCMG
ncbi:hypothetical protein [Butyricimonas virosa]|uniref:hypothetical protein n=1 Tax=Butyricimonas virosa TaxID=544645 RepID=UPI00242EF068|nr:hypothetical protein [Butyricimonas virosa]